MDFKLKKSKFRKLSEIYNFFKELFQLNGNFFMPASLTFYLIISFIPLISIVFMILSFYSNNYTDAIISLLNSLEILPEDMVESFVSYVKTINMTDYITLIISIIASIYVASRGVECFARFSNTFYGISDKEISFLKRKSRSILITFVFIILTSLSLIVYAVFSTVVEQRLNIMLSAFFKYLIIGLIIFILILFLFKVAPKKKEAVKNIIPGAIICTISLIICVLVYSAYLKYSFSRMSSIYGPLTSVIILLLLVFVVAYIFFISFYFNILLSERRKKKIKSKEPVYDIKHERVIFIDNKTIKVNNINTSINKSEK